MRNISRSRIGAVVAVGLVWLGGCQSIRERAEAIDDGACYAIDELGYVKEWADWIALGQVTKVSPGEEEVRFDFGFKSGRANFRADKTLHGKPPKGRIVLGYYVDFTRFEQHGQVPRVGQSYVVWAHEGEIDGVPAGCLKDLP